MRTGILKDGFGLLLRLAVALALIALIWNLWQMLAAMDQRRVLAKATLRLQPGQAVIVGRHELVAPAADLDHLQVSRDQQGQWWLANVSARLSVELRRGKEPQRLRSVVLRAGQSIVVAGLAWHVVAVAPQLVLRRSGNDESVWAFDGATLSRLTGSTTGLEAQPPCTDASLVTRLRQHWNRWSPAALAWPAAVSWGGSADCGHYMPNPGLAPNALIIERRDDNFWLHADSASARQVCLVTGEGDDCADGGSLFEQIVSLNSVGQLVVGRTTLGVSTDQDALHLVPLRRSGWLAAEATAPSIESRVVRNAPTRVATMPLLTWEAAEFDHWRWPLPVGPSLSAALAFLVVVAMASWINLRDGGMRATHALMFSGSAVMLAVSVSAFLAGPLLGEALSLALASLAIGLVIVLPTRTGWAWLAQALMALMLLVGMALQWQLGSQAVDNGGWIYFQKTAALAACAFFSIQLVAWWLHATSRRRNGFAFPALFGLELMLLGLAMIALALLALQTAFGTEEGVFGIQPVELAKLALIVFGAHVLSLRLEWMHLGGWRRWTLWWRMVLPIALFIALGAAALLMLKDYSPLLLMVGWLVGITLAWCIAAGSWGAGLLLVLAVLAGMHGWTWVRGDGLEWLQVHGFYGDRFAVWMEPLRHPHSGEQVLRAMRVMVGGGWTGDALAPAWWIPAVHDDMAPAFFVGRFGIRAAVALLLLQLAYVASLLMLGWRALLAARPGDHRLRWGLRLVFFAAWGIAALFSAHLLLSWGTNTGALPVMGQPMPMLSAGGSVIAMLLAPLQLLWLVQPALSSASVGVAGLAPGKRRGERTARAQ